MRLFPLRAHSDSSHCSLGVEWILDVEPYGSTWRLLRKTFHEEFKPEVLAKYDGLQQSAVRALLRTLVTEPQEFRENIKQCVTESDYGALLNTDLAAAV